MFTGAEGCGDDSRGIDEVTITIQDDDTFKYRENTVLDFTSLGEEFHHTDQNTLKRVR